MKRYAVYVGASGTFIGAGSRWDAKHHTRDPQGARVFFREMDAQRVAAQEGGVLVPLMLWYGPHAPHGRDWK